MTEERRLVALVEPSGRGGLAHFTFALAEALAERGDRVVVLTSVDYEMQDRPRSFEVWRVFSRYRTNPLRLWRALGRISGGIVHVQGAAHPELYLPLLCMMRARGCTVVYSVHDITPRQWRWFPRSVVRLLFALPHRLMAHSRTVEVRLANDYGVPQARLAMVPCGHFGFLATPSQRANEHPPATGATEPRILFFGFILPQKGLMDLIEAFRSVVDEMPEARLAIAGQPIEPVSPYLHRIRTLGLESHVELDLDYVPVERVGTFFERARVVALPYRETTQSAVLLTAYGFGRPVVATRCDGLIEYIDDGRTGLLVPPADPRALAAALLELLRNPARAERMGLEAQQWSGTELSWARVAALTGQTYDIARGARAAGEPRPINETT